VHRVSGSRPRFSINMMRATLVISPHTPFA
jgi:hypothetical protein